MRPMLSIKIIDSDIGIVLDKDKIFPPTRVDYGPLFRTYRWNVSYSVAENCALILEGMIGEEKAGEENETDS